MVLMLFFLLGSALVGAFLKPSALTICLIGSLVVGLTAGIWITGQV